MRIGARKAVLVSTLVALVAGGLLVGLSVPAQAEDRARIDNLFQQAKDLWERGRVEEAAGVLKNLLADDPSHETAYDLLRRAETQMFLDMLKLGGDSELVAKRLMDLAYLGEQEKVKDEGAIRELVGQAINGADYGERQKAVRMLIARHGQYAVPYLYHYLGSNSTDERVHAVFALSELSSQAVLPLVEVLNSEDHKIQQNASHVLQKIGDLRALGGLASLAARATNPAVKDAAMAAATSLLSGVTCEGGMCGENCLDCLLKTGEFTPASAYLMLARKYYLKDAAVIKNYNAGYTLWSWTDGKLESREVPKWVYNLELAEECCYDALAAEPGSTMARDLLAAIHYAEWGTVDNLSDEVKGMEEIEALVDRVWNVLAITAAQGPDTQLGALAIGLKWHDANIANNALAALPKVWDGREITEDSPLVAALGAEDKTIRFAASIAALHLGAIAPFPGSDLVIDIAAQAAATGSVRQVLIIDPDTTSRAKALRAAEMAGMYGMAESSAIAGFRRAKEVGSFDVIVIRATLVDALAMTIVKDLGEDFRTAGVPILISGTEDERNAAEELLGSKVAGYIAADPFEIDTVKEAAANSLNDDQKRALVVSKAACDALATIDPVHTAFENYAAAEGELGSVLTSDKPDEIRLAALAALAKIGSTASIDVLIQTFRETANSVPVRVATAHTLGAILSVKAAPANVFDALLAGLGDEAKDVRAAAGVGLGEMMLTDDQKNTVLEQFRVE